MCSLYSSVCIKYHKIKSKVSSVEEGQEASRRDTGYLGLDRRRGGEKGLQSWINNLAYGGTAPSPVWPGPSVWVSMAGVQARQINCSQTEKALL